MKEKWTAGKTGGCVVSDTPNRHRMADDHVDYYGGYLVAESIPKQEYVDLIAAAPDAVELIGELTTALKDLGEWLAYGLEKPDGAQPTVEDIRRCEEIGERAGAACAKGHKFLGIDYEVTFPAQATRVVNAAIATKEQS